MKSLRTIVLACLAISYAFTANNARSAEPDFGKDVAPILNKYCVGCHSEKETEAELRLDTYAHLKKGGENGSLIDSKDLANSLLVARITDREEPMPPEGEPQPSKAEIAKLISWVKAGAKKPAKKLDPTVVEFDKIKPGKATKSLSAIAYRPGGQIIVMGDDMISGVDIVSKNASLVPDNQGGRRADAAPFTFYLSNTAKRVTLGNLGSEVKLKGELRLKASYAGF